MREISFLVSISYLSMNPGKSRVTRAVACRGRSVWAAAVLLAAVMMAAGIPVAPAANADDHTALDCAGDLGDPVPGSVEWDQADLNNQQCAAEGLRMIQNNPAKSPVPGTDKRLRKKDLGLIWGGQRR